ncbi:FAD-dependent monooxygenase [Nocardia cyriacigeorgica]|uniref:FAD-dependent monooxygenase n=1 Tax=Nocardia cyriacigeorgica TaxID=135487 RepID=A0A6P1D360_9NOCA|nr:NAD(P)/FAD-dependent oxidoreductase [Nocardia cyriacigeorgica]NEW39545.1 FAD-dependent monooxygenase [Nocardia cyriacigeorgica]NEW43959.1 FAD-dependent monooxygenase [Nocardia cyriacigeorgica]NEW50034.1 FAD-dependent monooxygenase [Nocardia cyriacigeorgica]NEW56507.1 FAD-dependent monooxygenase [Nocardia cyriacigeorgica]
MVERHAEVIGGGIGGLTAATALAQRGWTVRLHERQSAIRAIGAGIYVWDNGLSALEEIGAFADATRGAHIGPAIEARSRTGRTLYRIDINGQGRPRCYTLLRDRLIAALVRAATTAGVELIADSAAVAADPGGRVEFEDGRSITADLIVVANGVHSRLRDRLGLTARRVRMREGAARLMVPASVDYLPPEDSVKHLEHFQGRRRLLYTPCTPESVYLALVADADDPATRGDGIDVDSWVRSFPYLAPILRAAPEVQIRWDNFEFIRLSTWSRGKVAFLGDAAHAQPPYLGQGGGTAMINAVSLAATVSDDLPLSDALARWEREQRPGIERTQKTSYRMRLLNSVPDRVRDPLLITAGRLPGLTHSQLAATRLRPATSGVDADIPLPERRGTR